MSSPKPPKASAAQTALEAAQLREYNSKIAEEKAAVETRRTEIKKKSLGRQTLLTGSETGTVPVATGGSI
jgi:hypothetical protein